MKKQLIKINDSNIIDINRITHFKINGFFKMVYMEGSFGISLTDEEYNKLIQNFSIKELK